MGFRLRLVLMILSSIFMFDSLYSSNCSSNIFYKLLKSDTDRVMSVLRDMREDREAFLELLDDIFQQYQVSLDTPAFAKRLRRALGTNGTQGERLENKNHFKKRYFLYGLILFGFAIAAVIVIPYLKTPKVAPIHPVPSWEPVKAPLATLDTVNLAPVYMEGVRKGFVSEVVKSLEEPVLEEPIGAKELCVGEIIPVIELVSDVKAELLVSSFAGLSLAFVKNVALLAGCFDWINSGAVMGDKFLISKLDMSATI